MEQIRTKSILCISLLSAVCLFACTTGEELDQPAGRYPMTFTATVDGLTLTRSDGKDAWTAGDRIAISIDEGSSSKTYQITDATTGAMEPATAGEECYWQKNTGQRILAWYPAAGASDVTISDQSSGNFSSFDYLTADKTFDFTTAAVQLEFKHQMAKVKCVLVKGKGISDSDISSATVQIYGNTVVSFTKGQLSGSSDGWITPSSIDREVLVVPRQIQGQFIKVAIGTDSDEDKDLFYYTPTTDEANLLAGNQYTYTITVNRTGLSVSVGSGSGDWTSSGDETVTGTEESI